MVGVQCDVLGCNKTVSLFPSMHECINCTTPPTNFWTMTTIDEAKVLDQQMNPLILKQDDIHPSVVFSLSLYPAILLGKLQSACTQLEVTTCIRMSRHISVNTLLP